MHYSGAGRTPPHHSAGKGPAYVFEEDEAAVSSDEDEDDEEAAPGFHRDPYHQDVLGSSQLWDAPFGTQGETQVLLIRYVTCHFNLP
jgi:predicted HD phosphohydrolase